MAPFTRTHSTWILEKGREKIFAVTVAVGYADLAMFGRHFRKYERMSPALYRRQHNTTVAETPATPS